MRFKVVAIDRKHQEEKGGFPQKLENALNNPPVGYQLHSWNMVPGWQITSADNARPINMLPAYHIVYEQLPEPVVVNKKERKFKEIDE